MTAPTFVSTYTGAGGLDIGFMMAGFVPVFSNEIDADAVSTYRSMLHEAKKEFPTLPFEEAHATLGDISQVSHLPTRGEADLVIGGPPCQGFSVAGRMDPHDPRSRHVWNFFGIVERVQPRAFIMENVKALAVNTRWETVRRGLLQRAEQLGYRTQIHLLNASHFGVPQKRERMFLVGVREPERPFRPPSPTTLCSPPAARDALERLPAWGEQGNATKCTALITPAKNPVLRKSPFAGMLFNGQGRPIDLDSPAPTLPASMGGNRTPIIDQEQLIHGGANWIEDYHSHLMAGGSPTKAVPERMRRLTVEEAAAIQTFPPRMNWIGSQSSKFRQIGNAVPPLLAFHVATSVRQALTPFSNVPFQSFLGLELPVDQYSSPGL